MLETAWESRWLPGSISWEDAHSCKKKLPLKRFGRRTETSVLILEAGGWQYGSGRCTLKTAHRKFSIKRAMQTANDADGGNVFPDITAEEAGYSATARIERKRERTRDGALQRNVRKRHQFAMIRKSFYITVQRISITDAEHPSSRFRHITKNITKAASKQAYAVLFRFCCMAEQLSKILPIASRKTKHEF